MTGRARRTLTLLTVTACLLVSPTGAQSAEEVESGVWWQLNQGSAGVAPAAVLADIPEGGLWLNSGPNGDTALSAVRFRVAEGHVPEEVVLRVHQDSSTAPAVALCAPANNWEAPEDRPGPWEQRAIPDCDRFAAAGVVERDVIRFPLPKSVPRDVVDLVLTRVPADTQSYVNVTFERPSASDLKTAAPVSAGGFTPPVTVETAPSNERFTSSGGDSGVELGADASPFPGTAAGDGEVPAGRTTSEGDGNSRSTEASAKRRVPSPAVITEAWDGGRRSALVMLVVLTAWIGAIARRRLVARPTTQRFTLYGGDPPV